MTEPNLYSPDDRLRDRARGALLGLAVGDALGAAVEFKGRGTFPRLTGYRAGGTWNLERGQWTDDTAMALALAESLARRGEIVARDVVERWLSWLDDGTYSCTGECFDVGTQTRAALEDWRARGYGRARRQRRQRRRVTATTVVGRPRSALEVATEIWSGDLGWGSTGGEQPALPRCSGNGALMRLAPVAIRYALDANAALSATEEQTRLTHPSAECVAAGEDLCLDLLDALSGRGREVIAALSDEARDPATVRSTGYVVDTLDAARWAVGRGGGFAATVLRAVNLGGDADTVGAVAGQLAGAIYGASAIPRRWLRELAWRRRLTVAVDDLLDAALAERDARVERRGRTDERAERGRRREAISV